MQLQSIDLGTGM